MIEQKRNSVGMLWSMCASVVLFVSFVACLMIVFGDSKYSLGMDGAFFVLIVCSLMAWGLFTCVVMLPFVFFAFWIFDKFCKGKHLLTWCWMFAVSALALIVQFGFERVLESENFPWFYLITVLVDSVLLYGLGVLCGLFKKTDA